jgi:hypothetical protein
LNKSKYGAHNRRIFSPAGSSNCVDPKIKILFYAGGPFTEYAVAAKWIEKAGKYYNEECRYDIIITSRVQV